MLGVKYEKWHNIVLFQLIWFAAVLGREALILLPVLLVVLHVLLCADRKVELKIMLLGAGLGVVVDTALTLSGVFLFDPSSSPLPIPLWLIVLWLGFAATIRHSLSYLVAKPFIAIPAASLGAPLSYVAGMRLGAVEFGFGTPFTFILLAVLWAPMMAAFIWMSRISTASESDTAPASAS